MAQSTASITQISCTCELSPTNNKDAELNRQLPFGIDLNKILPDLLLKLRTKVETPDIQFSQHIPYRHSLTVNVIYVLFINAFIKKLMKVKKKPRTQVQFQMCF